MPDDTLRVLMLTSEAVPFAKTGGLADVAGALPAELRGLGVEVKGVLPLYASIDTARLERVTAPRWVDFPTGPVEFALWRGNGEGDVEWWFVDAPAFFDRPALYNTKEGDYLDNLARFTFFCRTALWATKELGWQPDIYHLNDWPTAIPAVWLSARSQLGEVDLLDPFFARARTVYSVHNLGHQGIFGLDQFPTTMLSASYATGNGVEHFGSINMMKGALLFADQIVAVSQRYAEEIQTGAYGFGLDGLIRQRRAKVVGILNGVDYGEWNPATDPYLPANYSAADLSGKATCRQELLATLGLDPSDPGPVIGVVARLAWQKGIDLLCTAMDAIIERGFRFVLLGTGEADLEDWLRAIAARYPDRTGIQLSYSNSLAHQIEAGCDLFAMPSRYEPSGLNQFYSLAYGTPPVVRNTGGLADSVQEWDPATGQGNGFLHDDFTAESLLAALDRAKAAFADPAAWQQLQLNGLAYRRPWHEAASEYLALYRDLLPWKRFDD